MGIKRTFDILDHAVENFLKDDNFAVKRNGEWEKFSAKQIKESANNFSYALLNFGFKKGDKIATVSNNRPEWNIADYGMEQAGIVHVPVYPNISEAEYEHILSHSEAKMLIVSSEERYNYIAPIAKKLKSVEYILTFDKVKNVKNFSDLLNEGAEQKDSFTEKLQEIRNSVSEDDLSSIIYTSGTTGLSKGVMLTHKNFVSNVLQSVVAVPENCEHAISFLPLNHVFERMLNYLFFYLGIRIYYAESLETLVDNIKEVRPHIFAAVPRIFERIYDKIYATGLELKGIKRAIFFWALNIGQQYDPSIKQSGMYYKKLNLANKLVFSKWREVLGGNIKVVVSGGAALQPRLAKVFSAAGIPILEGYGLTETSPVISVNRIDNIQPGTVGQLLETSEVKIADDGEILFKGPNLMKGYFNNPEKTAEVIDNEGWFHTGDTGELNNNILKITGRKKEIFKLSTGKYVSPELIENKMKESPFIEQVLTVGEGEKYTAAIICPAFEHLQGWARIHQIKFDNNLELITNQKVIDRIREEVESMNKQLDHSMQIKKFSLVCEEWTPETGELSPTLKLKRRILVEKYKVKLDYLYGYSNDEGFVKSSN